MNEKRQELLRKPGAKRAPEVTGNPVDQAKAIQARLLVLDFDTVEMLDTDLLAISLQTIAGERRIAMEPETAKRLALAMLESLSKHEQG